METIYPFFLLFSLFLLLTAGIIFKKDEIPKTKPVIVRKALTGFYFLRTKYCDSKKVSLKNK